MIADIVRSRLDLARRADPGHHQHRIPGNTPQEP